MDRQAGEDRSAAEGDIRVLRAAREGVLERLGAACTRAGRDPRDVRLVAVSKTVPAERLRLATTAGFDLFGENRVQEAAAKASLLPGPRWHLVGHLQHNKARTALELFDLIETVDSVELARRLDRLLAEGAVGRAVPYPVLLQVNVDADPAKAGFDPDELAAALPELAALPNLRLEGLMTVGRLVTGAEEARPTFVALRRLSERLRASGEAGRSLGGALSMGMSDDFEVACEEGATLVRVGRALFGERASAAR